MALTKVIKLLRPAVAALGALLLPAGTYAFPQERQPSDSASATIDTVTISLLTCAPGPDIYELEGHSGLRIQSGDTDYVVNWGLFDFNSPGFVYRFVKGETDYCVGTHPTAQFLAAYGMAGRQVTEQTLALSQPQAQRVVELVEQNLSGERYYRYNYVLDNCATRPLQLLRRALAPDTLLLPNPQKALDCSATFRGVMRRFHSHYPWYQFGIDLALGPGIDRQLTAEQWAFAPVVLEQMAAGAMIAGPGDANPHRLVAATTVVVAGRPGGMVEPPTPWYLTPMAAGVALLVITLVVCLFNINRRRVSRWLHAWLFGIYGMAGCLITFLVFVSEHEATTPNALLLWLNPLCLLVPALIYIRRCHGFLICYYFVNFAALIALWPVMLIMNQSGNLAFIPMVAADAICSATFIHIALCERKKRKNPYRTNFSGRFYYH